MIGLFPLNLKVLLEMAKREEKATFCARFVHDRGAALAIRHDLSGDTCLRENLGYHFHVSFARMCMCIGTFE